MSLPDYRINQVVIVNSNLFHQIELMSYHPNSTKLSYSKYLNHLNHPKLIYYYSKLTFLDLLNRLRLHLLVKQWLVVGLVGYISITKSKMSYQSHQKKLADFPVYSI